MMKFQRDKKWNRNSIRSVPLFQPDKFSDGLERFHSHELSSHDLISAAHSLFSVRLKHQIPLW